MFRTAFDLLINVHRESTSAQKEIHAEVFDKNYMTFISYKKCKIRASNCINMENLHNDSKKKRFCYSVFNDFPAVIYIAGGSFFSFRTAF